MCADDLVVERLDAQTGRVRHIDKAVLHDGVRQTDGDLIPPRNVDGVVFQRQEVLRRRNAVDGGHTRNGRFRHVNGHRYAVILRHIADLLVLVDAAGRQQVGMDHRHTTRFEQRFEAFLEIDVLAGADGRRTRVRQPDVLIRHLPGEHILVPGQVELIQPPGDLDAVLDADVAEVVGCQRRFIADDSAHVGDVLLQIFQARLRHMNAGEGMHHVLNIVRLLTHLQLRLGVGVA